MKSHVRENYVKNAVANMYTAIENKDGSKTIIPNDFAKYLISENLDSRLIVKNWKLNDHKWALTVETKGGSSFSVLGNSILNCIENANKKMSEGL